MNLQRFDRALARIAQPGVVLRAAALSICLLELAAAGAALLGYRTDPYDGALPALYRRMGGGTNDATLLLLCLGLLLAFAWQYWLLAREGSSDQPPPHALARILLVDALAMAVTPGLPFLVTALAAVLLQVRTALLFALAQIAANLMLYWLLPSGEVPTLMDSLGLFMAMLALHGMAFGLGRMAATEADKRRLLQVMLAERLSAEQLQGEQLRYAERLSLARELHDVFGHHLTALNLQLQLGSALLARSDAAGASQAVERAREGAAQLLADVREAVSAQRAQGRIDLSAALQALADGIASARIEVDIAEAARDLSPRAAHALLRCVQEAVTNSVRHGRASRINIALTASVEEIAVSIDDDGPGAPGHAAGNGLKGMAERMAELGGTMQVTRASPGFCIELRCPRSA